VAEANVPAWSSARYATPEFAVVMIVRSSSVFVAPE